MGGPCKMGVSWLPAKPDGVAVLNSHLGRASQQVQSPVDPSPVHKRQQITDISNGQRLQPDVQEIAAGVSRDQRMPGMLEIRL